MINISEAEIKTAFKKATADIDKLEESGDITAEEAQIMRDDTRQQLIDEAIGKTLIALRKILGTRPICQS